MEQADDQVGFLFLFQNLHPFAGACYHFFEAESFPQVLMQPVRDGGCEHSQYGNLYTVTLEYGVRSHIRLACLDVNDIGTQRGTVQVFYPFVVNGMPCLYVMIAKGLGVVLQVVDDCCGDIGLVRLDIVGVVASGLSLKDIAVIHQNQVLPI